MSEGQFAAQEIDLDNLTVETAAGQGKYCQVCESIEEPQDHFVDCRLCTRRSLAARAMCVTCAQEMNRCCRCTKLLTVASKAEEVPAESVAAGVKGVDAKQDEEETDKDPAESSGGSDDDPVKIMIKVRNACFFYNGLAEPDALKLAPELLPPMKAVLAAANSGDVQALRQALDSSELKAAGGLPKDLFAWLPLPTWLEYDGEDGPLSKKYLEVIKMLTQHGAVVTDEELLAACQRFGLRAPPNIMSNMTLNRVISWASDYGFVPVFKFLHERGANGRVPIGEMCGEERLDVLKYMLEAKLLPTPAQSEEEGSTAQQLVKEGFSFADMSGRKRVIQFLVDDVGYDRKRFCDHGERHEPMD